jgi:hypothetical protein
MHNSLKIIKILLYSYSALHVSGTLAPIIRSLPILHKQPPVTVCRWIGCIFQLCSVTTLFTTLKQICFCQYQYENYFKNTFNRGCLGDKTNSPSLCHLQNVSL